jgi:hypothetical protein
VRAGENVGYVIPGLVVNHFLNDLARHGEWCQVVAVQAAQAAHGWAVQLQC